jgi:hypothetical protein
MRPRLHLHLLLLVLLAGGGAWRGGGAAPPGGALTQPTPPPRAAAPATAAPARPSKASPPLACPAFAPGSPQLLVDADCRWRSGQAPPAAGLAPGESVKIAGSPSLGFIPALLLEQGAAADAAAAAAASAAGGCRWWRVCMCRGVRVISRASVCACVLSSQRGMNTHDAALRSPHAPPHTTITRRLLAVAQEAHAGGRDAARQGQRAAPALPPRPARHAAHKAEPDGRAAGRERRRLQGPPGRL